MKNFFQKMYHLQLSASFTIEAAVIIPISFAIMSWLIVEAFDIHNRTVNYATAVSSVIENGTAPSSNSSTALNISGAVPSEDYSKLINTDNLDGRKVLLKYKLAKEGLKLITGGLDNED